MTGSWTGMYRGVVVEGVDPLLMGRVQVLVPAVLGDTSSCGP